ncbi:MAG TPA: hypothetical protein VLY24_14830 [Bryobacteraceae bacterium]|nr:hypothetical protein [Bryobacteraceae bacterium]
MEEKTAGTAPHTTGCLFCDAVKPFLEHVWSDATRDHFRNSRVEFLKGLRSLLDARIAHLSREESKGTHVVVE